MSTTATWVTSSSAWANVSMTRRTYVCCAPTPSDCWDTSVWPTSGPVRLPARQLASVAFWSGSVALPLRVNDAPPVDVHSTVWSAPAVAVGGWFSERALEGDVDAHRLVVVIRENAGTARVVAVGRVLRADRVVVPVAGADGGLAVDGGGKVAVQVAPVVRPVDTQRERLLVERVDGEAVARRGVRCRCRGPCPARTRRRRRRAS